MAEFFHHNQGGVLVDGLVDGDHHAHFHQGFDHFHAFDCHFVRQIGNGNGFGNQDFVNDRFGRRLEGVLVRLEFEFLTFFTAAYALVVAVAGVAVASAFSAFAFGIAALTVIVAIVAVFFFRTRRVGGFVVGRRCLGFFSRFALFTGFGFGCGLGLLIRLLFHGFTTRLTLLFFFQQGFLMGAQSGGTARFFIALRLLFRADHRLRSGWSSGFCRFFRVFAFITFVLFRLGFAFGRFFRRPLGRFFFRLNCLCSRFCRFVVGFAFSCLRFGRFFSRFNRFRFFRFGFRLGFGRFGSFQFRSFGFGFRTRFGTGGGFCFGFCLFFSLVFRFCLLGFLCFGYRFGFGFGGKLFRRRNRYGAAAFAFDFDAAYGADFGFFAADADGSAVIAVFLFQIGVQQLLVVQRQGIAAAVFIDACFFQLFQQIIDGAFQFGGKLFYGCVTHLYPH